MSNTHIIDIKCSHCKKKYMHTVQYYGNEAYGDIKNSICVFCNYWNPITPKMLKKERVYHVNG